MATIYEGTERNQQQVDERIDPEILRALGLSDVSDLDYDEYKTLLKERLASSRVQQQYEKDNQRRIDQAALDEKIYNEFKRVQRETGRFRVKNEKISFQKMLPGNQPQGGGGAIVPNVTFVQQPNQDQEKQQSDQSQPIGLNEFLTGVVAPSLAKIESSLFAILENLTGQQKAEDKAANQSRIAGEKSKKRAKENKFEGLGVMASKAANIAKKVFNPLSAIFGAIFNFLSNILTGFLVLKVLDWINDPRKLFIDINNLFIMWMNTVLKIASDITFFPFNMFTKGLNTGLDLFEDAINNTVGKIPGVPKLDLPDIPKAPAPEIPLIPYPKLKNDEPRKKEEAPKVPASALSEGGPVTNIFQLMSDGGRVRTDTGDRVSGAGPDTQLVALQPGEFVMSKSAVDTFGLDTMMDMNAMGGGTNKPKMAKVQSVKGGGQIMAMRGGGFMGSTNVVDIGYKDDSGRPVMLSPSAGAAFKQMIQDGMPYNSRDVANVYRDKAEYERLISQGYKPAKNSYHNYGEAADIHGQMNTWIRKHGAKYGWKANDYSGSHGGHFEFKGGGSVPPQNNETTQVQPQETVTGKQNPQQMVTGSSPKGYKSNLMPSPAAAKLLQKMGVESQDWKIYKDTLASIETKGMSLEKAYSVSGGTNGAYDGRYQMGSAAKVDSARILGIPVPSRAEFRSNPQLQEDMILAYTFANNNYMLSHNIPTYNSADSREKLAYLGFAHNQGHVHAANWLLSNKTKDPTRDGFGTSGTKFTKALTTSFSTGSTKRDESGSPESTQSQPQSGQVSSMSGATDTQYEKTPYAGGDLPSISLGPIKIDDTNSMEKLLGIKKKSSPPPPPRRSGGGSDTVPVLAAKGPQSPTSMTSSSGSTAPSFSPLDTKNPELIVVKAIYNIVG